MMSPIEAPACDHTGMGYAEGEEGEEEEFRINTVPLGSSEASKMRR